MRGEFIFLTGATGFLGGELLVRLLQDRRARVVALVRLRPGQSLAQRRQQLLSTLLPEGGDPYGDRLILVGGDLGIPGAGLSPGDRERVTGCQWFLHGAATVRFDLSIDEARRHNVAGTREVMTLARESARTGRLRRFDYISTAYVAGLRRDLCREGELRHRAGFRNSYEQSKSEAEAMVREGRQEIPGSIYRPSIIVGDSRTGRTPNFNTLYWPLKVYARGWWRTLIGDPDAPIDAVPVDFVADAIRALGRREDSLNRCFHLATGPVRGTTVREVARLAQAQLSGPEVKFMKPESFYRWWKPWMDLGLFLLGTRGRALRRGGEVMLPYFAGNPLFDTTEADSLLEEEGIHVPVLKDYFPALLAYAQGLGWDLHGEKPSS